MKKISTSVVAIALGMSECDIREKYEGAKEIEYAEGLRLMENTKIKRYTEEADEYRKNLESIKAIMG